jgi:hypothetical protein
MCLSVTDDSLNNGAALLQWECFGASHTDQLWDISQP